MKRGIPLVSIFSLSLFIHYYALTTIKIGATDGFKGKLQEVKIQKSGLYENAQLIFDSNQFIFGEEVIVKKIVNWVKPSSLQLEKGETYKIKSFDNWLCKVTKI